MRLSRLADYAIAVMTHVAQHPGESHAAAETASLTRLPGPTVARIMARLCRSGFLTSSRGVNGGYRLARPAAEIPVGAIVSLFDGPILLTRCAQAGPRGCDVESVCPSRSGLKRLTEAVHKALHDVSLAELAQDEPPRAIARGAAPPPRAANPAAAKSFNTRPSP